MESVLFLDINDDMFVDIYGNTERDGARRHGDLTDAAAGMRTYPARDDLGAYWILARMEAVTDTHLIMRVLLNTGRTRLIMTPRPDGFEAVTDTRELPAALVEEMAAAGSVPVLPFPLDADDD